MLKNPGFWTYALASVAGMAAATGVTQSLHLSGGVDLAVSLGVLFGLIYAVTPAALRGDVKRLWAIAFLAFGAMLAAAIGATHLGASAGFARATASGDPSGASVLVTTLAVAGLAAMGCYLALFRLGWGFLRPKPAAPAAA